MTKPNGRRLQNGLTVAVGLIATAAQAQGMWNFFGDQFQISNPYLRGGLFAFIELAILASALRARRHRIDHGSLGVDGVAVWGLAFLSGLLSATDTHTAGATLGRLIVPLVAAWMFERAISVERADKVGALNGIPWRITPQRVLVWLRLADPSERDVADVARTHRLAQLARYAYRVDQVRTGRRKARMQRRLVRRLLRVNSELRLATDAIMMAELRSNLATVFQALGEMTPDAVADLRPWRGTRGVATPRNPAGTPGSGTPEAGSTEPRHPAIKGVTGTPLNGSGTPTPGTPAKGVDTPAPLTATPLSVRFRNPATNGSDTPRQNPAGTPAPRTVPEPPAPPATSTGTPDGTGSDTPEEFPADAVLLTVLRDPTKVSREFDGTVPVKRAMKVLGAGRPRVLRLLKAEGLLRETPTDGGSDTPAGTGSVEGSDDDQERVPEPLRINGYHPAELIGAAS